MLDLKTITQLEFNEMTSVQGGSDRPALLDYQSFVKQLEESTNQNS